MNHICVNGKMEEEDIPVLRADNRGYRYGDGIFETIRVCRGKIPLAALHFDRLFSSLQLLDFPVPVHFTKEKLTTEIISLCARNQCENSGRVRVSLSRGRGDLNDGDLSPVYIIEAWPLDSGSTGFNQNGLIIDIFPDGQKTCDKFSGIKSSSGQLYSLAALYARKQKWNDCLILNGSNRIADSTIANVFIVKDGILVTPGIGEGSIDGVMRRYLLSQLQDAGYSIQESRIEPGDLLKADEVFLTNAIKGIRWNKVYIHKISSEIFSRFVATIFE
jgi:branched-chain amino acid aminotransferase